MKNIFIIALVSIFMIACVTPNKTTSLLSGDVYTDGSSTVFPITQAAAEEFIKANPGVRVTVGISGTGGGFKKFCNNETVISNASRPITKAERDACNTNGVEYVELPIAYDALSVVVNPGNNWADCLTISELKTMWHPDGQGVVFNWNQVRSSFPDKTLRLYGPGADSGTFDYFTGVVNGKEKLSRGDFYASEDDNVLVSGVAGDEGAIGYFGLSYVTENVGKIKPVGIDNGNGNCVLPSIDTVKNGTYNPFSRPIFIYVNSRFVNTSPVREFVQYYLSESFIPIISSREVGYVGLEPVVYSALRNRFANNVTGTLFPNGAEPGSGLDRYIN